MVIGACHLIFIEVHVFGNWKHILIHFHIYINMQLLGGPPLFSSNLANFLFVFKGHILPLKVRKFWSSGGILTNP